MTGCTEASSLAEVISIMYSIHSNSDTSGRLARIPAKHVEHKPSIEIDNHDMFSKSLVDANLGVDLI